jgi:hypothetical protein
MALSFDAHGDPDHSSQARQAGRLARDALAYLDARIRSGSSSFWAIGDAGAALSRLARDLETGEWERRYCELLALEEYDAGYRLVISP